MFFCQYNYCIYNNNRSCVLNTISISDLGFCSECIIPVINDEVVEKYKK